MILAWLCKWKALDRCVVSYTDTAKPTIGIIQVVLHGFDFRSLYTALNKRGKRSRLSYAFCVGTCALMKCNTEKIEDRFCFCMTPIVFALKEIVEDKRVFVSFCNALFIFLGWLKAPLPPHSVTAVTALASVIEKKGALDRNRVKCHTLCISEAKIQNRK